MSIHETSKDKYNIVLCDNDAFKVLNTVINICLYIFEHNENASFGFIGESKENEKKGEVTQRFRIYKYITINLFGNKRFKHYLNKEKNSYLLVNTCHQDCELIKNKAEKMFIDLYPDW